MLPLLRGGGVDIARVCLIVPQGLCRVITEGGEALEGPTQHDSMVGRLIE